MRKNIIIIIFASVLICGCHRADGQLQETVTDETTHQVDSFISPELVWQDNSRDLYSATGMPTALSFEELKSDISGGNSMAAMGMQHAAALKKHFFIDGDSVNCWDEMVYIGSDGEKKSIRITEGFEKQVTGIGSIWASEHYVAFSSEPAENTPHGFKYVICELDEDMSEVSRVDLDFFVSDYVTPLSMSEDKDGNVHLIYSKQEEEYSYSCHYCIVSADGKLPWEIELDNEENVSLNPLGDGTVALWNSGEIFMVDSAAASETRLEKLEGYGGCFTYWDENNILFADKDGVYLKNTSDGNTQTLYLWKNHGIRVSNAETVSGSQEQGINVLYSDSNGYGFVHLEPTTQEVEVKSITFAVDHWNKNAYSAAVADFNRMYPAYRINLTEYQYDDQKMLTELIAGEGPVIIDTALVEFEDMTKYWEPLDDIFDQMGITDELIPEAVNMGRVDDKFYGVVTNFRIRTVITAMKDMDGWNYEEFIKCIDDRKDSLKSIFYGNSMDDGTAFVLKYFMHGLKDNYFIDSVNGTTSFDTEAFRNVIELGKQYQGTNGKYENLLDGSMLCLDVEIKKPLDIPYLRLLMGDDVNFIGYPCEDGNGHYMAPTSMLAVRDNAGDEEKRIAHSFIKLMLSYKEQLEASESDDFDISVRKDVFEHQLSEIDTKVSCYIMGLPVVNIEEEQLDYDKDRKLLLDLIEKSTPDSSLPVELNDVMAEELVNYFEGDMDVDKVISNLKGRVELYLGERMSR